MRLASLPCGVLILDNDLKIVEANQHASDVLGYSIQELCSLAIPELLSRGAQIFFHTHVNPSLALEGRVDEVYLQLRARSGGDVPVIVNGTREVEPEGTRVTLAFVSVRRRQLFEHELVAARDAAEAAARLEREAQGRVKQAHAQLALNERLASLGTLAHGIAHEINNPLTYVAGSLELLATALGAPGALDRADLLALASEAKEGTERIREITRQMGSLVRADELPRVPLDLKSAASMAARMTKSQTRSRATVELALSDVPLVDADSGRLGQVLINLIINAVQAFGDRPAKQNLVRVSTGTAADGWARIEVSDNGPGIPSDIRDRVFEPFFTTKPVGEGTGLGLSISRSLVESLDGTLTFESEIGQGTTFRVSLPPSSVGRRKTVSPPGSKPRVLVVDDDEGVARMLARVLRRYDVTVAHSADEALARIRSEQPFDFVFSDLQMPKQNGLALHDAIEASDPELASRMAFVTGAVPDDARRRLAELGLQVFTKPLEVAKLIAFCDEHIPLNQA